jgi:transcriptional regulator
MYTPKKFQFKDNDEILNFIRHNGFGILVSTTDGQLSASHIPMFLSADGTKLSGHLSKGNKQWKGFGSSGEVMAIFSGPHAYISSSWYDHQNVPTWNYVAAHIYGSLRIIQGEELHQSLKELMEKYEKHSEKPVTMESFSPGYIPREMNAIVGFEILITKIEGANKLSQNRDDKNHDAIIDALEKRGDTSSVEIASLMKNERPSH